MSPLRPDLVACWLYRVTGDGQLEILLIHRAPGRMYPGLWQCVTGRLEAGETIVAGALREVAEETGMGPAAIEALFETDIVNWFHEVAVDGLMSEAVFAARLRLDAAITISDEHDDLRWLTPAEAHELVTWPSYHRAIEQLEWLVANPDRAAVYRLPDPT
ncbi:MAG TPA: NUDIX domain-containing protein [Candidatus Limnocylindrales bacterium]|jgi:8-oxo-dGTP pyrophosphatase MutT (NUDIX family)